MDLSRCNIPCKPVRSVPIEIPCAAPGPDNPKRNLGSQMGGTCAGSRFGGGHRRMRRISCGLLGVGTGPQQQRSSGHHSSGADHLPVRWRWQLFLLDLPGRASAQDTALHRHGSRIPFQGHADKRISGPRDFHPWLCFRLGTAGFSLRWDTLRAQGVLRPELHLAGQARQSAYDEESQDYAGTLPTILADRRAALKFRRSGA